jgi:acetyl-CoA carboxylase biotin carboxylase subunit
MQRALQECAITGVCTTLSFHQKILANPAFQSGLVYTNFVEQMMAAPIKVS